MNKKGFEGLVLSVAYLLFIALILVAMIYFINSSSEGKLAKMNLKSKEVALLIDVASNQDSFAETELVIPKEDEEFSISLSLDSKQIKVKEKHGILERVSRIFLSGNKKVLIDDKENEFLISVENE